MSRLATSFVLGYHGCERDIAERAVAGEIDLLKSDKRYDWLGPGAYFWESDPVRAKEWADKRVKEGAYATASVVGAVIELRNCLDLVAREDLAILRAAYDSFMILQSVSGLTAPVNRNLLKGGDSDRRLRFLDCAVIKHLHFIIESADETAQIEPYDSVRGMFLEGNELYPGGGFREKTHVQIAVRNNDCIRGLFFPPEFRRLPTP